MSKSLVHQARFAFGTVLGLHTDQSTIKAQTRFELEENLSPEVGISLPMYYAFYYQPLFQCFGSQKLDSEAFLSAKMNEWLYGLLTTPDDPRESPPEARAFLDLARNGNKLVWTMTTLVAGLNACLTPKDAILVLSTALSVRYDPRCVLPAHGSWSCPQFPVRCDSNSLSACIKHPQSDIPSQVRRFFEQGSQQTKLQRPRYGLDCTLGKRLAEDFILISRLADRCGLQREMSRYPASSLSQRDKADLTLALVALTSQTLPWTVEVVSGGEPHSMHHAIFVRHLSRSVLQVHTSAAIVNHFVNAIQSTGIPISVEMGAKWSRFYPQMESVPKSNRQAWYESMVYNHLLKTVSWNPSAGAYQEWQRYRTPRPKQQRSDTLEQREAFTAILTDPYVRQLKREYGPSMTPSAAFAGPSTEVDIDLMYYNYQNQIACHEGSVAKARADARQAGWIDQSAIDPEDRPDRADTADGSLSDPEPESSWTVTVQQILELYDSSTTTPPELPADDVAIS